MDGVLCKTADGDVTKEIQNQNAHREARFSKKDLSSKESSPAKEELSEIKKEKAEANGINGSETRRSPDHNKGSETPLHKSTSSSPTFIGSAFKAVKSLFSPEKPKSVHSGVLSPIIQQKNAAGPPCGSICVSGKTELFCTDSGISFHSGDNFQINEAGGIQSPLTCDYLNNTNESYSTTVSLIDESFHSAVTDFGENGDSLKAGPAAVEPIPNGSPNADLVDSCNNTLETNDSYLENTTLKLDSVTPEGRSAKVSAHGRAASSETLNDIQSAFRDDYFGNIEVLEDETVDEGELRKNICESRASNADAEGFEAREEVEVADIFFSKSFEKASSQQSEISVNDSDLCVSESCKSNENVTGAQDVEVLSEGSNRDCFVGDSISTTTVVLEPHHSPDLDNLLPASREGCYEAQISTATFDEGVHVTSSSENVEKLCSADRLSCNKQSSECLDRLVNHKTTRMLSPLKKFVSEGNSPGNRAVKIKLNKSDELINRRTSSESPEGKNNCSVDISLMKNVESSELSEEFILSQQLEVGKPETNPSANKPEAIPVTSQLSYTILINHNNILNRPVVESSCSFNSPKKQTFQAVEEENSDKFLANDCSEGSLDETPEVKQSTPLWSGNNEKGQQFFRCSTLKLSSPEARERGRDDVNDVARTPKGKSDLLSKAMDIFSSSEAVLEFSPVGPVEERESALFNAAEASGMTPRGKFKDSEKQSEALRKPGSPRVQKSPRQKGKANTPIRSNNLDPYKLNLTFDKLPVSPRLKNSNSTFVKSEDLPDAEQTFDVISPDPAQINKAHDKPPGQLNQTFDSKADCLGAQKPNETFDKKRPEPPLHNKINQVVGSCQEMLEQEMNETSDSVPIAERNLPKPAEAETTDAKKAQPPSESIKSDASSEFNDSPGSSKNSISLVSNEFSSALPNDEFFPNDESLDFSEKLQKMNACENLAQTVSMPRLKDLPDEQEEEKLLNSLKDDKLQCDPELVQLIQEQFSSNDIEKICSAVQDLSSMKLSSDILKASEQFDKSFHGNVAEQDFEAAEKPEKDEKSTQPISPQNFDFLNSIGGKSTARDWSRESLYIKFDPLVPHTANSLIDFTKEGQVLPPIEDSPAEPNDSNVCEQLLNISPQKKTADIVPPLTPLSHKVKANDSESKTERLKELQNEIYFLKNLYAERERTTKARVEDCENQLAKLTGDVCLLEDKLKESNEREKSLVKKMKEQTQNIRQLNVIMEEYVNVISKLTSELETVKADNAKQMESLSLEKDSYMTHLQNTEAAFTDVHAKYEKSKKTIASLKANEAMFKVTVAEQASRLEEFAAKAREAEERASGDLQKAREELSETKASHVQEATRLKAQLRKTELKVEALQESLEQKIKENQQLTAICDELIEGKK